MTDRQNFPFIFQKASETEFVRFEREGLIYEAQRSGFFLCTQGEIVLTFGGTTYRIKKGSMYIYFPSTYIRLEKKSDDFDGIMAVAELEFVLPIINKVLNTEKVLFIRRHPCISISDGQFEIISQTFEYTRRRIRLQSCNENNDNTILRILYLSLAQVTIYEVLNIYFSNRPILPLSRDRFDDLFQQFMISLHKHFKTERSVSFYAAEAALSPRYFSAAIKEKSGSTPFEWITRMMIVNIKQMLEENGKSIKEIAIAFNFPNQSFFGKYFKRYAGESPKEYRKRMTTENRSVSINREGIE